MNLTLFISLLFFACSSSFSISKWKQPYRQIHGKEERPNTNEAYKVEYSTNNLEFVFPKARARSPTLREIVYYHLIERPSGGGSSMSQESSSNSGSVEDNVAETERPFTNGHGYQFLPEPGHEDSAAEEEAVTTEIVEDQSEEETTDDEESPADKEVDAVTTAVNEVHPVDEASEMEEEYDETTEVDATTDDTTTHKETEEHTSTKEEEKKEEVEDKSVNSSTTEEEITETTKEPSIDPRIGVDKDEVIEEKRNTRAALFSQAKEKYHNRRMSKTQHRRKRQVEASDIPDAPTLRPLNLDSLPEYARKLLSTPEQVKTTQKTATEKYKHEEPETNEAALKKELQHRIEEMMATLKPAALEDDIPERDGSIEAEHGKKRIARTYGMNLTEDKGYVWNDLLGDPGMFVEVGDLEEKNEIPQHNEATEAPSAIISSTHYSAESKPIYMEHSNEKDRNKDNKSEDLEDIFVEVKTNRPMDSIKHSTKKDIDNNVEQHTEKTTDTHTDSATESNKSTTESFGNDANEKDLELPTKESENDVTAHKKHGDETSADNTDQGNGINNGAMNEKARKAIMEITQSELIQELLKNEQFWKWLGDWTNTYTELLMKHIKHMVHEEVGRQMKTYTANLKKEIQKGAEEASQLKEKKSAKEDKEKANEKNDKNINEDTSAIKHSEESKAEKQNHEDVMIIIDGKELPITHNSNLKGEDLLKRRKDKENDHKNPPKDTENAVSEQENKGKPTIAVTAQNVYGNSAGSDKVTNIFVFYPHDDTLINDFKPNDDVDLIDKRKEDDVADLVAQRDESTSTTDVPSKATTNTSVDNNIDFATKPDEEEHKNDVTTQKISTDLSKDIEKDGNKQQELTKDKVDTTEASSTTEATTIFDENKALESEDSTKKTEHKENIANNESITEKPSVDLEKVTVTTEHIDTEKNLDRDIVNEEKTTKVPIDDNNETTETAVESKDIAKISSTESENKDSKATIKDDKQTDGTESHTTNKDTDELKS